MKIGINLLTLSWRIKVARNFWKFWNCRRLAWAILKFSKMDSGNLSQIALPNMRLLALIHLFFSTDEPNAGSSTHTCTGFIPATHAQICHSKWPCTYHFRRFRPLQTILLFILGKYSIVYAEIGEIADRLLNSSCFYQRWSVWCLNILGFVTSK